MSPQDVLITGISSGIGLATARMLVECGYRIFGATGQPSAIAGLHGVTPVTLDLMQSDSIQAAAEFIIDQTGGIDILINCADHSKFGAIEETCIDDARQQMQINVFGVMELTQLMLPRMREAGHGRIVNVSSLAGEVSSPLGGWYHASKIALETLSDSLRKEVKQFGIDVVVVQPGYVATDWLNSVLKSPNSSAGTSAYAAMWEAWRASLASDAMAEEMNTVTEVARTLYHAATMPNPKSCCRVGKSTDLAVVLATLTPDRLETLSRMHYGLDKLSDHPNSEIL